MVKLGHYFLRTNSKITLIKALEDGTSLLLPDTFFLLFKVWATSNITKKIQAVFSKTDETLVLGWCKVYASLYYASSVSSLILQDNGGMSYVDITLY